MISSGSYKTFILCRSQELMRSWIYSNGELSLAPILPYSAFLSTLYNFSSWLFQHHFIYH